MMEKQSADLPSVVLLCTGFVQVYVWNLSPFSSAVVRKYLLHINISKKKKKAGK